MSIVCPVCNTELSLGAAVCPTCGYNLAGKTEAFSPVNIEGEAAKPAKSIPVLRVTKGPYNGQEFAMHEGTFSVGRDPSCDLFLNNTTVSRKHATIVIDGDSAKVVDEGSLNGTWVDGCVVDEAPLSPGTTLQIGTFEMVFERKLAS